jgi:hypothetical protein
MLVTVKKLLDPNQKIIEFITTCGEGMAIIHTGKEIHPQLQLYIEIEVEGIFTYGKNLLKAEEEQERFTLNSNGLNKLTGYIESVEDDGILFLRIKENLIMVESLSESVKQGDYVTLILSPNEFILYDIGLN